MGLDSGRVISLQIRWISKTGYPKKIKEEATDMKERRFRISCMCGWDPNTFGTFDEFADRICAAKDMGYEAVELSLGKPLGYEPKRMMKLLSSMNMPIANFLTGGNGVKDGLYFSSRDPEIRAKAVERICELIPIASEMGASMVIGTMQGKTVEPDYEVGKARVIDCLKQIASTAEKYNQLIVLEPMNFMDCAYHHTLEGQCRRYGSSAASAISQCSTRFI